MKMVIAMAALALLTSGAAAQPVAEAEELGRRLAHSGDFQAIIGAAAAGEIDGIAAKHPELSANERADLAATARAEFQQARTILLGKIGPIYARHFTVEELRGIVGFFESPAGRAYTGRLLTLVPAVAAAVSGYDFKKEAGAAFCRKTGKLCEPDK
jgi:hypothetical protein